MHCRDTCIWNCGSRQNGACGAAAHITEGAAGPPGKALRSAAARRLRCCCRAHPKALRGFLHWSFGCRRNGARGAAAQITQGAAGPPGEALRSAAARQPRRCLRAHPRHCWYACIGASEGSITGPAALLQCSHKELRGRLHLSCGRSRNGACGNASGIARALLGGI